MRLKPATDPGHCGKNNLFTYLSIIFFCLNHAKISPHLDMLGFWMGGGRGYSASSVKKGEWNSCSILQQLSKKKVPPPQTTLDMTLIFKEVRKRWNKASHSFVINHIFQRFSSFSFYWGSHLSSHWTPQGQTSVPIIKKHNLSILFTFEDFYCLLNLFCSIQTLPDMTSYSSKKGLDRQSVWTRGGLTIRLR